MRASFWSSLNMRSSMPARGGGPPYSAAERARNAGARAREGAQREPRSRPTFDGSAIGLDPDPFTPARKFRVFGDFNPASNDIRALGAFFCPFVTPKPGAVGGGRCVGGPATAGPCPWG